MTNLRNRSNAAELIESMIDPVGYLALLNYLDVSADELKGREFYPYSYDADFASIGAAGEATQSVIIKPADVFVCTRISATFALATTAGGQIARAPLNRNPDGQANNGTPAANSNVPNAAPSIDAIEIEIRGGRNPWMESPVWLANFVGREGSRRLEIARVASGDTWLVRVINRHAAYVVTGQINFEGFVFKK